jgi:hypothetical protein
MKYFKNFLLTTVILSIIILTGCTFIINNGDNAAVYLHKNTRVEGNKADANIPLIP